VHALRTDCEASHAVSCLQYGKELSAGRLVPAQNLEAGEALARACDLGNYPGCFELTKLLHGNDVNVFSNACERGDNVACFILGRAFSQGFGLPRNDLMARTLFLRACGNGFSRACSLLGQIYMAGRAGPADPVKALAAFEQACAANDASACYNAGTLYVTGKAGRRDVLLAQDRFRQACGLGVKGACKIIEGVEAQLKQGRGRQDSLPR
jgi:hypothetical protein